MGAAYLAGLAVGFWSDVKEVEVYWQKEKIFESGMNNDTRVALQKGWGKAVKAAMVWGEE